MRFRPEHYLEAAYERIDAARKLHNEQHYPEAVYFAGVAVECLLLAYKTRREPEFESRHDLRKLLKESGMADFIRHKELMKLSRASGRSVVPLEEQLPLCFIQQTVIGIQKVKT
jgi:HEPN domain-containing protein